MAKDRYLQAVRGAAIVSVVLIHSLPQCEVSVALRPFLNWAVATFLFLSGFLTSENNMARGGVLKRRFSRTLPPYLIWSVAYALFLQHRNAVGAIASLLTAGASAQMYFIAVYLQLMILTPLLYRLLKQRPLMTYLVTPICLACYELITALGFAVPELVRLFPMWLIFYVVGLDWDRWRGLLKGKLRTMVCALVCCLAIQAVAGFSWCEFGDYNMATTQLKVSSMMTSLSAIAVIMLLPVSVKNWLSRSPLANLGDLSFGIYLCHVFVLVATRKMLALLEIPLALDAFLLWALTLLFSVVFCIFVSKVLPKRIARMLGMA